MGFDFIMEYNHWINRLKKADKYFSDDKVNDEKKTQPKILEGFNDIISNVSRMQTEYKRVVGEEMKEIDKFNGFKC